MSTYLTRDELVELDSKDLNTYAENIGFTDIDKRKKIENRIEDILTFQENNPPTINTESIPDTVDDEEAYKQALSEQDQEDKETEEEVQGSVATQMIQNQNKLVSVLTDVLKQSNNQVKVQGNPNLLKTEKGKAKFMEMKKLGEQLVLIRLNKNNNRMSGEKYVIFDFGNDLYSIYWQIRLNQPWYVPKLLIPFLRSKAYQSLEVGDSADIPVTVGSGEAVSLSNFKPEINREFTLEILEDRGETARQIAERLSKQRKGNNHDEGQDIFDALKNTLKLS